jgi:radical SAM superfamily enzyme YgiQ (UPF0313 family)
MRKNSIPQMTLAYMAGLLETEGHQLSVHDCIASGIDEDELLSEMASFDPRLAFINTTTPTINSDLAFSEKLKARFPAITTVVFGTHVTVLHQQVIEESSTLDVVIRGEPEFVALGLVHALENGGISSPIPGCTVRVNGGAQAGPDLSYADDLDRIEHPAWNYLPLDQYIHPVFKKRYLSVNTSRGCKHRCIFCVAPKYYGDAVRLRSPESVVREIRRNIDQFDIRHYWFYADDFTANPEYVKKLCRAILSAELDIVWWSNTRVDKLDEEMFRLMKKSGAVMLSIGGESGSKEILRRMKKATKPIFITNTVDLLRRVGIDSVVYFLFGLPGETKETIRETIDFAKTTNADYVEFYPATPYPGTEFFDIAVRDGLMTDVDWDDYQYSDTVMKLPEVDGSELRKMIKRGYLEYYLRPGYLVIFLKKIARPADFLRLMKFGFGYMRGILTGGS